MSASAKKEVMLSAVKPTNFITLGNYLGAIRNWAKYVEDYDAIFFMVDLHSITVRQDPKELREATYRGLATYIAAGLDPTKCILFAQSHVPAHAELAWVLNCFSYMGELSRMTQYKDKSSKAGANISVGLFTYPALMAADILLYNAKRIPVGEDQKQHVEITRDIAIRMNNLYGDLFTVPEPMIPPVGARIMDLQNPESKMSKSEENENGTIFMFDTDKDIEKKLKRAVTDSGNEISFSDDKPGVKNLLSIQAVLTEKSPADLVASYAGKQYGHLKVDTAEIVVNAVRPIREEAQRLLNDKGELDRIMARGAMQARERAEPTLRRVYDAVGFLPNLGASK